MTDGEFAYARFTAATESERELLCERLASRLATFVARGPTLHAGALLAIDYLRSLGHDLWSLDSDDDSEVWGPNYATPRGPGVIVTLRHGEPALVEWTSAWSPRS